MVDGDGGSVHFDAEAFACGLDDSNICLVRHDQREVVRGDAGVSHRLFGRIHHDAHRPTEDLFAFHVDGAANVCPEDFTCAAVGIKIPSE